MAKPPKMLIAAKKTAVYDRILSIKDCEFSREMIAPISMMPEMALDTLIKGE